MSLALFQIYATKNYSGSQDKRGPTPYVQSVPKKVAVECK